MAGPSKQESSMRVHVFSFTDDTQFGSNEIFQFMLLSIWPIAPVVCSFERLVRERPTRAREALGCSFKDASRLRCPSFCRRCGRGVVPPQCTRCFVALS